MTFSRYQNKNFLIKCGRLSVDHQAQVTITQRFIDDKTLENGWMGQRNFKFGRFDKKSSAIPKKSKSVETSVDKISSEYIFTNIQILFTHRPLPPTVALDNMVVSLILISIFFTNGLKNIEMKKSTSTKSHLPTFNQMIIPTRWRMLSKTKQNYVENYL